MNNKEKTNLELLTELEDLKQKYSGLLNSHEEINNRLKKTQ